MPTSLTRWRPFAELDELRSRMDRMFEEFMGHEPWPARKAATWAPAVDVHRSDGTLIVRADVPGFKPEEVSVEVEDDVLTVSGKHEESEEEEKRDYVRRERRYGEFCRSIALPDGVDADKIEAVTHDGVLEVTVPLPEKAAAARKVITPKGA